MKYRVYGNHPDKGWISLYASNEAVMWYQIALLRSQGYTGIGVQSLYGSEE